MADRVALTELTDDEKIRRLPWAFVHIATNSVFIQLAFMGPIFVLFLVELGLDKAQIGLLLAFFPLAGIVAPLVAPVVARIGYKRTFVILWGARKIVARNHQVLGVNIRVRSRRHRDESHERKA